MSRLTALRLAVAIALIAVSSGVAILASQKSAAAMQRAASTFVESLTPDQKSKAMFPFASDERQRWHFIPNEMFPRKGLMLKDMSEAQRVLAFDLLRSGLSSTGYTKVRTIMELEDILKLAEAGGQFARNKEEYLFAIFGTPGVAGQWGWRFEGHHVSIRFAIADGAVAHDIASSPMFLGANPAIVQEGEFKGRAPLHDEELAARAFLTALPADLQKQAIVNAVAPGDILTMNKNDIAPLQQQGVSYAALAPKQQAQLMAVIEAYTSSMEADIAAERMAKITAAGLQGIRFAWLGEIEAGRGGHV